MGDRRPVGEKEYSPLEDSLDLINKVLTNNPSEIAPISKMRLVEVQEQPKASLKTEEKSSNPKWGESRTKRHRNPEEELVVFKFKLPRADYQRVKNIVKALERELDGKIDLSHLGRGWVTRLITAEKEIIDAARQQDRLQNANTRNPLEIAEIDHAMTVIQSVAFRRAAQVR